MPSLDVSQGGERKASEGDSENTGHMRKKT